MSEEGRIIAQNVRMFLSGEKSKNRRDLDRSETLKNCSLLTVRFITSSIIDDISSLEVLSESSGLAEALRRSMVLLMNDTSGLCHVN